MKSWFALKIIYPTINKLSSKKKLPNSSHSRKMAYPNHFSSVPIPDINNEHSLTTKALCSKRRICLYGLGSEQWRWQIDNWGGGGGILIYSCSAYLISFEIDCFYSLSTRIYEYLSPPPPHNYRSASATGSE